MKRRVLRETFLAALLMPALSGAADTEYLQSISDARYHRVDAEQIGRPFHVYVSLPAGYDERGDADYPAIYTLDGGGLFPMFAAYYRYLNFGEEIPDAIIVGISYGSDNFEGGNFRSTDFTAPSAERDYWGGAPAFQAFLSDELIPLIEGSYRADSERRVIFGQSLGGQFVLYTAQTRPGLFWGHVASNPALHRNLEFFLERHVPAGTVSGSRLFVGSGTNDDPVFREPALAWIDRWGDEDDLPWTLYTTDLEGESHMSAPPTSFRRGMRWLFSAD